MRVFQLLPCAVLLTTALAPARASDSEAKFASGAGNVIFLTAGTLLPLIEDKDGEQHSMRTADAALTSTILAEVLKTITHEKRPDSNEHTSFPSGHATAAFAVATMESHYHPKQALLWYGGATIIGASRVQLHRHHWYDVVAGAGLGYLTGKWELSRPRGLLLQPFIHDEGPRQRAAGLQFSHSF